MRHQLTAALGHANEQIAPAFHTVTPRPGDRVLLCTDGLWDMVEDREIARLVLAAPDAPTAATRLIEAANAAGGDDNVTAVVVFFGATS